MRITFFIQNMSRGAGSERATSLLANHFAEQGHEVTILSICGDNTSFFELNQKIELHTLFDARTVDNRKQFFRVLKRLVEHFERFPTDICIDIFPSLSIYSNLIKKRFNFRNITWDHTGFNNKDGMLQIARKHFVGKSDALVVLTEEDRRSYRDVLGLKSRVILNISPYGISKSLGGGSKSKTVLAVGRLTRLKRFDLLLKVWADVETRCPDWTLDIVGAGEELDNLKSIAGELSLEHVVFSGLARDMREKYSNAAVLVSTSEKEGLPMVMIEAASLGIPTVSLDYRNGPRDIIINGITGLIAVGDTLDKQVDLFTKQLVFLLHHRDFLDQMSVEAIKSSVRFDARSIGEKWDAVLNDLEPGWGRQ